MIVSDIFKFGGLKDAKVVAGAKGLNNEITSISVLEVAETKIKTWVLENQLYITSFYAIMQNIERQKSVILALHEKKSSGLVICHIELFLKEIHPEIIDLCNELGFPLIVANSKRSYIEILNPIILRLMGNPESKYEDVIKMQDKLIEYIATKRDISTIFKIMTEEYGRKIFFLDVTNKILYPKLDEEAPEINNIVKEHFNYIRSKCKEDGYCVIDGKPVKRIILTVESNKFNYGLILTEYYENTFNRDLRFLKSISNLCTLIFTNNSRISELENIRKQEYIGDLITWNFRSDDVAIRMGQDVGWDILNKCRVIIINLNDIQSHSINISEFEKFVNEVLYDKIKEVVRLDNKNNLLGLRSDIFIILMERSKEDTGERAKKLANHCLKCCKDNFRGSVSIGISSDLESFKQIPEGYIEAMDAAKIGRTFLGDNQVVSFEDIGFYGLFRDLRNMSKFKSIEKNVLSKLKQFDLENDFDLYKTLKTLVLNNMNTEETAKKLYIHKNTVNYRKRKIVEILGYEPWNMPYLMNTIISIVSEYF